MILGAARTPFQRPAGANPNFQPALPDVGFYSHIQPFPGVMQPVSARYSRIGLPAQMGPIPLPAVPAAMPPAAPVAAASPKPGGVAGAGFGSTGGTRNHFHVDPYMVMRQGMIPGVSQSGSNIRAGVRNAGQRVQASMPFQTQALAPLPQAAIPPVVTAVVPSTGIKGFLGALGFPPTVKSRRRKRSWFSPAVAEQQHCETIGPRADGLFVTICDGRVVSMSDGRGNVTPFPYNA
jgi:hypothetical protein